MRTTHPVNSQLLVVELGTLWFIAQFLKLTWLDSSFQKLKMNQSVLDHQSARLRVRMQRIRFMSVSDEVVSIGRRNEIVDMINFDTLHS